MTPLDKVYCPGSYFAMTWCTCPKHIWSYFSEIMRDLFNFILQCLQTFRILMIWDCHWPHINFLLIFSLNLPECLSWLSSFGGSALWFPLTRTSGVSSEMMVGQWGTNGEILQECQWHYIGWEMSLGVESVITRKTATFLLGWRMFFLSTLKAREASLALQEVKDSEGKRKGRQICSWGAYRQYLTLRRQ